jgi:hypothetical protein
MPYVILAVAPWTPKASGWLNALEEKKEKKIVVSAEGLETEDMDSYGKEHTQPCQQVIACLQRYLMENEVAGA